MDTANYFKHIRSIVSAPAADCLALARKAAEIDRLAEIKKLPLPVVVWTECLPDGTNVGRFSNGVTVY